MKIFEDDDYDEKLQSVQVKDIIQERENKKKKIMIMDNQDKNKEKYTKEEIRMTKK